MNSSDMLLTFRDEMSDAEAPYLWSDAAFYRYLDDAQKMFCRLTEGIEDARTITLSVVPGTEWYPISKLVLKLRSANRTDTGREVPIISMEKARIEGVTFDGSTGPVKVLVSGYEKDALRAWPLPDETVTVALNVFRLPLIKIEESDQELEVDDQHEAGLLLWVKSRAYNKQDAETFNKTKAIEFEAQFRQYCAAAKTEQERRRHPAGNVVYGGL